MITDAHKKANKKWDKENLERISLIVHKGEKEIIKSLAQAKKESINFYILQAVKERALKDGIKF